MNSDDRKYLAYLTAWAVDRIVTGNCNLKNRESAIRECTYGELTNQADFIMKEYPDHIPDAEKKVTVSAYPEFGTDAVLPEHAMVAIDDSTLIPLMKLIRCYQKSLEKPEMTAKELVEHVGSMPCCASGEGDFRDGMQRMYDIFKKEAGL